MRTINDTVLRDATLARYGVVHHSRAYFAIRSTIRAAWMITAFTLSLILAFTR